MGYFTLVTIVITMIFSVSRIFAIQTYYVAPLRTSYHLEYVELPSLLTSLGHIPIQHNGTNEWDEWDLSPIKDLNNGEGLRLCYGKEWHRFTGSWLVPDGIEVRWIKSEFDGALPGRWKPSEKTENGWWRREGTRWATEGLNDLNEEESSQYVSSILSSRLFPSSRVLTFRPLSFFFPQVDPSTCHYLLDSHFPLRPIPAVDSLEPPYVLDTKTWDPLLCAPFLDAQNSKSFFRAFWVPGSWWGNNGRLGWGEFCLLARREGREGR